MRALAQARHVVSQFVDRAKIGNKFLDCDHGRFLRPLFGRNQYRDGMLVAAEQAVFQGRQLQPPAGRAGGFFWNVKNRGLELATASP